MAGNGVLKMSLDERIELGRQKAQEAATTYFDWITTGKAKKWITNSPPERRHYLEGRIGLQNFLDTWNSDKKRPLAHGEKGKREYQSLFQHFNRKTENFYNALNDKLEDKTKKAEKQIKTIIKEYWKEEAQKAATAYNTWINSGKAKKWLTNNPPKHRGHLEERIGLQNFLCNWDSDKKIPVEKKKEGKRDFRFIFQYFDCSTKSFYNTLDDNLKEKTQEAEEQAKNTVSAYWKQDLTRLIRKAFPRLPNEIAVGRSAAKREGFPYYDIFFSCFVPEPGEKERIIQTLIEHNELLELYKETDKPTCDDIKKFIKESRSFISRKENKPPQLIDYLERSNALKIDVGDMNKHQKLLRLIYKDFGHKTCELSWDTEERCVNTTSLNPNYHVNITTKPKDDTWGDKETAHSAFVKLFNDKKRWTRECKVAEALATAGITVEETRGITLNENYLTGAGWRSRHLETIPGAKALQTEKTVANKNGKGYRYVLTNNYVDSKTLRETLQDAFKKVENEAKENGPFWDLLDETVKAKLKASEEALKGILAEQKYGKLQEQLTQVNNLLHKVHEFKPNKSLEKHLERRDYQKYVEQRIHDASDLLSETIAHDKTPNSNHEKCRDLIEGLKKAYKNSGIGTQLNEYGKKYRKVIHGDLHPGNILVPKYTSGQLKLIDMEMTAIGLPQEDLVPILSQEYFVPEMENEAEREARNKTKQAFISNYVERASIKDRDEFLAGMGLFGMARSTVQLVHMAVRGIKATEGNKQHFNESYKRNLRALDEFTITATAYLPDRERVRQIDMILKYNAEVKRLATAETEKLAA